MSAVLAPLERAAARVAAYGAARHPLVGRRAGEEVARRVREGADAAESLAAAGAPRGVADFVRAASPGDLPALLDDLAGVLGRASARRAAVRHTALYPCALAAAALALAGLALRLAPGLDALRAVDPFQAAAGPLWIAPFAAVACAAALLWLALALLARVPLPPFVAGRLSFERALVLGAAAAAAARGARLDAALEGAAALSHSGLLAREARRAGEALRAGGEATPGPLLDEVSAGVLFAAAGGGAGPDLLAALAAHADVQAQGAMEDVARAAHLLTLLVAGAAVMLAGLALFLPYLRVLS